MSSLGRERRSWTAQEDQLLREAVEIEDPNNSNPSRWHAISKHVPGRTNKDCRKRWFAKMATDVVKGGWAPDEDERLVKAIEKHGTRWSLVAHVVQTRNSDQCAKRWTDTLNPAIDRTTWTAAQDDLLIRAVNEHGKVWTKIVKTYFPGRTGLAAKNRYNSITRFVSTSATRPRRDSAAPYERRKSVSSVTSAGNASPSSSAAPMSPTNSDAIPSLSSCIALKPEPSWSDQLPPLSTPSLPDTSMCAAMPRSAQSSDIYVGTKFEAMRCFPMLPNAASAYEQALQRQNMELQRRRSMQESMLSMPNDLALGAFPPAANASLDDPFFTHAGASMLGRASMPAFSPAGLPPLDPSYFDTAPYPVPVSAPQPTLPTNLNPSWSRQWDPYAAERQSQAQTNKSSNYVF
ncbi:hypothetical protein GGF50DRAFT_103627 [Schizophyllum commune]